MVLPSIPHIGIPHLHPRIELAYHHSRLAGWWLQNKRAEASWAFSLAVGPGSITHASQTQSQATWQQVRRQDNGEELCSACSKQEPGMHRPCIDTYCGSTAVGVLPGWRTLTVMPRSRSTCSLSRYCARPPRGMAPVISSSRSASVDLPWSTCAMMLKFLTCSRHAKVYDAVTPLRSVCMRTMMNLPWSTSNAACTPGNCMPLPLPRLLPGLYARSRWQICALAAAEAADI